MDKRWTIGDYTFTINPDNAKSKFTIVGDDAKTLNGNIISQPSFFKKELSLSSIIFGYNPRQQKITSLLDDYAVYTTHCIYTVNLAQKKIRKLNKDSLALIEEVSYTQTGSFVGFDICTANGAYYALVSYAGSDATVYLIDTLGALVSTKTFNLNFTSLTGFKYLFGYFYFLSSDGYLLKFDTDGFLKITSRFPLHMGGTTTYSGLTTTDDGRLNLVTIMTYQGATTERFVQTIDINKLSTMCSFLINISPTAIKSIFCVENQIAFLHIGGELSHYLMNDAHYKVLLLEQTLTTNPKLKMVDNNGVIDTFNVKNYQVERINDSFSKFRVQINGEIVDRGGN
jgi:hypothetical protein